MSITASFRDAEIERDYYRKVNAPAKLSVAARPAVSADLHPGVYKAFVACWAMLLTVFAATFAESPFTMFMIGICVAYAIMFFGVPYVMSRVGPPSTPVGNESFLEFLHGEVDTLYGRVSGMEALVQVIMVPLALVIGGVAIGLIVHFEADHIHMLYLARSGSFPQ